ncbi:Na+/H+ antiporter NhaC family protein [Alkalihalophilus lindianensis]|uniref:Na+/H+ antiporter NhaC family protein n=1 Tax=Alkalihalophilus lindianensis TaxID=1630542 RepID=A0ABU3X946_9BACI|nr:Na+/H+ antiporter NhaC family protein [Alkalihalophilus lindianensis]MDV2684401.1 Na+/H+ antiporter NhaC family protein [Alkalihalophilus lindianensis]
MEHMGILSLLPAIIAILIAIISKNVIISLFTGLFVGVLILANGRPIQATMETIGDYLFPQLTDSYNAAVLVLLVFIGGFVALMEKSGGAAAFAKSTIRFINTKAKAQLSAWFGGIIVFFSDLGTPLIVGPVFEKIYDKIKISREKLAWIIDSTSSPVAVLIPFIGWGVYIMGLIRQEFDNINLTDSEFTTFVQAIPFQFYSFLVILMVPLVALTKLEFGAMAKAERRVQETGELYWKTSKPLRKTDELNDGVISKPLLIWAPLLVLFVTLFGLLITFGFPFEPVAGGDFRIALSTAYLFASILLIVLMVLYKVKKINETFEIYLSGMQKMMYVAITLVLAWALGTVLSEMGTALYIVEIMEGNVPGYIVPAILFIAGALMSFATGSSWGTYAIMIPLAIPMAVGLDAHMLVCIGAVLSGGMFGDHCSPISDTTVLSSTGAGCDHIDHVKTQIPYAVLNASVALVAYIIAGITGSAISLIVAIILMAITVVIISRMQIRKTSEGMDIKG